MLGYQKIRAGEIGLTAALVSLIALLTIAGCGGTKEAERAAIPPATLEGFLNKYEKEFNPSDYDADLKEVQDREKRHREEVEAALVAANAMPETIPGFRVQVTFTQDIDEANEMRENLTNQLPDEWVYIVYDAPYYKVRVGNFIDHLSAGPLMKRLERLGYLDAWIVPDNIIKNPPPKPPDEFIEPEKHPPENQRPK